MNNRYSKIPGAYISSMKFLTDIKERYRPQEGLKLGYGYVIKQIPEKNMVRILTNMVQQRPTSDSDPSINDLEQRNTIDAMVMSRDLSFMFGDANVEKFVGDLKLPKKGAIVVYAFISGVVQNSITPIIFGSIFPQAGCYNFKEFLDKLAEIKDLGYIDYVKDEFGHYSYKKVDGSLVRGFKNEVDFEAGSDESLRKVWEEETKKDGEYTKTFYDGNEDALMITNIKDGKKITTYTDVAGDTVVTEEKGNITYEFPSGGFKTEISGSGVKTFSAGALGVDLVTHIHPSPAGATSPATPQ